MDSPQYYKTNYRALRFRELWRLAGGDLFWFINGLSIKFLGARDDLINVHTKCNTVQSLTEAELPGASRALLVTRVRQCESFGCTFKLYYRDAERPGCTAAAAVLSHKDKRIGVSVIYTAIGNGPPRIITGCTSILQDAQRIVTSNGRRVHDLGLSIVEYLPEASPQLLINHHIDRIDSITEYVSPFPQTPEEILNLIGSHEQAVCDKFIERGVWIPMTETEIETYHHAVNRQKAQLEKHRTTPSPRRRRRWFIR